MKKILALLVTMALLLAVVAGCTENQPAPTASSETPVVSDATGPTEPTTPGSVKDTLVEQVISDIATLDPHNTGSAADLQVADEVYDSLVREMDSEAKPRLADSWTASDDGLSYTFVLHKGVKFSNGEELKASDVVFSLKRAVASPYLGGVLEAMKDVEAVDDSTVKFTLNFPYAPFVTTLSNVYILNEKAVTEAGENYGLDNAVGTGPYMYSSHAVGQSMTLTRNDDYFLGAGQIREVTYKVITDPVTAYLAVQSGEIDFAASVPTANLGEAEASGTLALYPFDSRGLSMISINCARAPFDKKEVRQAIAYAISKEDMVVLAEDGSGTVAENLWNDLTFGYSADVKGYEQNIEKAKELLVQAGYPDGFSCSIVTIDGNFKKVAEVLQSQLAAINITLNIDVQDPTAYMDNVVTKRDFDLVSDRITLYTDADSWSLILKSDAGFNYCGYKNPQVDTLFDEARALLDPQQRIEKYKQIATIIMEDLPFIPMYFTRYTVVHDKNLKIGGQDSGFYIPVEWMSWE